METNQARELSGFPNGFPNTFQDLQIMNLLYSGAVREICTKLETLDQEFKMIHDRNPIQHVTHRIKQPDHIREKMLRLGLPLNWETMREEITDIGGVRIICSYINDIYDISKMLRRQDDILTVKIKDYILHPKPNGYRSYHLIVGVPVFFSKETQVIPVEIQMRTMAMDFWASLEHQLRYKNNARMPDVVRNRLTVLSDKIFETDNEMQDIYQSVLGGKRHEGTVEERGLGES